ncbi:MAG: YibE/F family protein [Desulfamplus sp.]|nr:YibE/F family protein [Desulfamplus sp.]
MTTTLLLPYSGGFITLLMAFMAQNVPLSNTLNLVYVSAEVVKTLIETGFVLPWDKMDMWVSRIHTLIEMKAESPETLQAISEMARAYVHQHFSWDTALADIDFFWGSASKARTGFCGAGAGTTTPRTAVPPTATTGSIFRGD